MIPLVLLALIILAWVAFLPNVYLILRGYPFLERPAPRASTPPEKFIIQITTVGRSPEVVDSILGAITAYSLPFPAETWVVTEEGDEHEYPATRVLRTPKAYRTPKGTRYKARALAYAREVRRELGLLTRTTRILFLDDDSLPSREYVVAAYWVGADMAHGSITIRRAPGGGIIPYVADHYRTADCVGTCPRYCSAGKVRVVHGEGMTVTGEVELVVGWDWGQGTVGNKAEDLLFGRRACLLGYSYAYIPERIYIVSPFTIRELYYQRRRWLWNVLSSWADLDPWQRVFTLGRLGGGFIGMIAAGLTLYVPLAHAFLPLWLTLSTASGTAAYFGFFAFGAWRNTRSRVEVLKALLLAWPASITEAAIMVLSFARPPHGFHVVRKALPTALTAARPASGGAAGGVSWQR